MAKKPTREDLAGYFKDLEKAKEFNLIYEEFKRPLHAFVNNILRNRQNTDEVVVDVFLALIPKLGNFESSQHLSRFLYMVARNEAINRIRKENTSAKHIPLIPLEDGQEFPSDMGLDLDILDNEVKWESQMELIWEEINRLPAQQREVFRLHVLGKTAKEIEMLLKIKENTVHSHVRKARKTLEKALRSKGFSLIFILLWVYIYFFKKLF